MQTPDSHPASPALGHVDGPALSNAQEPASGNIAKAVVSAAPLTDAAPVAASSADPASAGTSDPLTPAAHSADAAPSTPAPSVTFASLTHFLGFDWARFKQQVAVLDRDGKVLLELAFDDAAEGWALFRQKLADAVGDKAVVGVAIETNCGPAVERLLAMNLAVFPINPKAAERFGDRKRPGGAKSDPLDAWCFGDALRTDGHAWRQLLPLDPFTHELRLLCRDEIGLIAQRTVMVNQLRAALHEFYPAALEAFDDWTAPYAWQFVLAFPTPKALAIAGKRRWQNFLHTHKLYRPQTADKRLALFAGAMEFASPNAAVTSAKRLLAGALAQQLLTLQKQLDLYRAQIEKCFADHPDHDLFGSLPGAGEKIAPRLLAELGSNRQVFADAQALQCYAGAAPVTRQSGRSRLVGIRRACHKILRATVHLWADLSRMRCVWTQACYQAKKEQGMSHAAALRCLGQRWLKILWKIWQDRTTYDEARHTRNQVAHGSWIVRLQPPATSPQP